MALASGANVGLSYVVETTHGTTPSSPSMKALRSTGRNINLTKNTQQSEELRDDRQLADLRHGFNQVQGSIPYELSLQAYDDLLEAALSGTWAAGADTGATTLDATAGAFSRAAGSFLTDGFEVGDIVTASGFSTSGNNGRFRVTAVAATTLTVSPIDGQAMGTESGAGDEQVTAAGKKLKIGSTLRTFTIERRFTDINQYQVFKGVAVNQMSLSISPESIVGGSFELLGMSAQPFSGTSLGAPSAAPAETPLSSFDGALYEGGTQIGVVTGLDLTLNNNRTLEGVVGSQFSPDVFEGTCNVSGTLTAFFEDASLVDKFINETESSLDLLLDDINGTDFIRVRLPRLKYTGGDIDPPQQGPITLSMPFTALVDSEQGTTMTIQRSNS